MALQENLLNRFCLQENITQNFYKSICRGMCEQDYLGRTHLHVAMIFNQQGTLQAYQDVLKEIITQNNSFRATQYLIDKFRKLLKVYNHQGDTVLHTAVKLNLLEFVEVILKFCKKYNIKIEEMEQLGSGDNILHLAVKENYLEMVKVIVKLMPVLLNTKNYAGNLPLSESYMSLEVKLLTKMSQKDGSVAAISYI